jgi:hypothetical protein
MYATRKGRRFPVSGDSIPKRFAMPIFHDEDQVPGMRPFAPQAARAVIAQDQAPLAPRAAGDQGGRHAAHPPSPRRIDPARMRETNQGASMLEQRRGQRQWHRLAAHTQSSDGQRSFPRTRCERCCTRPPAVPTPGQTGPWPCGRQPPNLAYPGERVLFPLVSPHRAQGDQRVAGKGHRQYGPQHFFPPGRHRAGQTQAEEH